MSINTVLFCLQQILLTIVLLSWGYVIYATRIAAKWQLKEDYPAETQNLWDIQQQNIPTSHAAMWRYPQLFYCGWNELWKESEFKDSKKIYKKYIKILKLLKSGLKQENTWKEFMFSVNEKECSLFTCLSLLTSTKNTTFWVQILSISLIPIHFKHEALGWHPKRTCFK